MRRLVISSFLFCILAAFLLQPLHAQNPPTTDSTTTAQNAQNAPTVPVPPTAPTAPAATTDSTPQASPTSPTTATDRTARTPPAAAAGSSTGDKTNAHMPPPTTPLETSEASRVSSAAVIWTAILTLILVLVVLIPLCRAGRNPANAYILQLGPSFFFWLSMGYTGLLLIMAVGYNFYHQGTGSNPTLLNGILPIAVPWFGALGAVTISLEGVFMWNNQWKPQYNYWHIGRPLFGAVLGTVAFFLFVVIVTASGSPPQFLAGQNAQAKDFIIFYVVAFLVGYREETFRDLIKRATDLILKPGVPPVPSPAIIFKNKASGSILQALSLTPPANPTTVTVEVLNSGNAPLNSPAVTISFTPPATAATFTITNDQITPGGPLAPGEGRTVDVNFITPPAGSFSGTLSVTGANLGSPATLPITA